MQPEAKIKRECGAIARINSLFFWQIEGKGINGIPDTIAEHFRGGIVLIEFKTPEGVLSKQQEIRIEQLRYAGVRVSVCRSVEDYQRAVGLIGADEL